MPTETIYPSPGEHDPAPAQPNESEHHQPVPAPEPGPVPAPTMPARHFFGGSMPPPPNMPDVPSPSIAQPSEAGLPVPVIRVLSVRGVEYGMMTIALWVAAVTLAWVVLNMLNGSKGFDNVVVPVSALVICVPVFGLLFLRLKKAELADPNLRLDPSKRRWSQTTQFLAYLACLINLIYFVYSILQKASGNTGPSIGKALVNLIIVLIVAGGVLAYYWMDEHRTRRG